MYTYLADTSAVMVCGEGAAIIDHALSFGGGGCGVATHINGSKYGDAPHSANDRLIFGYGGAIIRYHFRSRDMVNVSVGGLIGAGGLSIATWNAASDDNEKLTPKRSEAVFVIEPQVGGHLNVTRWMRFGVTAGYRVVSQIAMPGLSAGSVSGPTLGGNVQFGWF